MTSHESAAGSLLVKSHLPLIAAGAALLLATSGCSSLGKPPHNQVTRWTPPAPVAGKTLPRGDATFPAYHLRRHGDLGAGRPAAGGGDAILDGLYYYRCAGDGMVSPLPPSEPLAEGWSVRFRPDRIEALPGDFSRAALEALLTVSVPDREMACAFRLSGRFDEVRLASGTVLRRVSGMIFGVRFPVGAAAPGDVAPSLEVCFLSGDLLNGGRIVDFRLIDGSLALDLCPRHLLINPASGPAMEQLRR